MDAIQALRERRTVRVYEENKPISRELIETIIDCGRFASTARNEQPWEFVVVTDAEHRKHIAGITQHGKHIANAPVCIAVLCSDTKYFIEDGSAATQNMLVAAWALGLGACWIAGDKKVYADDLRNFLGAPEGTKLVSLIALGYPAAISTPKKRTLAEVLHWERY
jgi:nitroreductase